MNGEDPVYSLGWKMQKYILESVSGGGLKMKEKKRAFLDSLTPEEAELYNDEVAGMPMRKMFKDELKKQRS